MLTSQVKNTRYHTIQFFLICYNTMLMCVEFSQPLTYLFLNCSEGFCQSMTSFDCSFYSKP